MTGSRGYFAKPASERESAQKMNTLFRADVTVSAWRHCAQRPGWAVVRWTGISSRRFVLLFGPRSVGRFELLNHLAEAFGHQRIEQRTGQADGWLVEMLEPFL
jgi:hypothetical protein